MHWHFSSRDQTPTICKASAPKWKAFYDIWFDIIDLNIICFVVVFVVVVFVVVKLLIFVCGFLF
jgi:hypothetical protein